MKKIEDKSLAVKVNGEEFALLTSSEIVKMMEKNRDLAIDYVDNQRCIIDRSVMTN